MIKLLGKIPRKIGIAFSGGIDSVVVTKFLLAGKHDITLFYYNHMTEFGKQSEEFCYKFAEEHNLPIFSESLKEDCPKHMSMEEFWRTKRYEFFYKYYHYDIITCHHLDDQMENWIFTGLHGNPRLIPYKNKHFIRPFLLNRKEEFYRYAIRNEIEDWMEDPSNQDTDYMRNYIRQNVMKHALHINPGLPKVIRKKILTEFKDCKQ
jgi:tRNA(Ile)-lysidine synthase